MDDWENVPVFGVHPSVEKRVIRPCVYALIHDDRGRLAVVRVGEHAYLPGGGIEAGESVEEAIMRETLEECGLTICPGVWMVRAVQFVYLESEKTYYEKRSTFIDGTLHGPVAIPTEIDHELVWVDAESATRILSHQSQRWAVEQWMIRRTV